MAHSRGLRSGAGGTERVTRISDLSKKGGVPVATIKFYVRERLLPQGTPTGRNQVEYGDSHLRRLLFIKALTNIGKLDLSSVRKILGSIEDDRLPLRGLYETIDRALFPDDPVSSEPEVLETLLGQVDGLVERLGWTVESSARGRLRLAQVLAALERLGCECGIDFFEPYARAAEGLTALELGLLERGGEGDGERAAAAVRSVLFEVAMSALRRMAQEHLLSVRPIGATSG